MGKAYQDTMELGREDIASQIQSLMVRSAASNVAEKPYLIKTLEEKFEEIDLGNPTKVIKDFGVAIKKLEKAFDAALSKINEHKSGDFKRMIDNSINKIKNNPDKSEELGSSLAKGIVQYIRNLDSRIKNTFTEYNK